MARAKLEVGQLGKVTTRNIGKRRYRARGRVRCADGELRQVQGDGDTAEGAREQLRANARVRAYTGGKGEITGSTTVMDLVVESLNRLRVGEGRAKPVRPQTIEQYETTYPVLRGEGGEAAIADLELVQVSPALIHGWLEAVSMRSPSTGKRCKVVLTRAFRLAMKYQAVGWAVNPAEDAELYTTEKKPTKALTPAEIQRARELVTAWQTPRKVVDMKGVVNLLLATGMRPAEVLAVRWEDVDLTVTPATVTVSGTVVELKGGKRAGGGLIRQPIAKTDAGWRRLRLPRWATALLMERWAQSEHELVFPSRNGGLLNPHNVNSRWREIRGEELAHVELRDFRRTMGTVLERTVGVEEAARQLGHESPAVTNRHYVEKAADAGDYSAVLEQLAP